MYLSRLSFHTVPGKTSEVERELQRLRDMVAAAGGAKPRILHTHFASLGAPDLVFEQEIPDLATFEAQMKKLTDSQDFQQWTSRLSRSADAIAQAGNLFDRRIADPRLERAFSNLRLCRPGACYIG